MKDELEIPPNPYETETVFDRPLPPLPWEFRPTWRIVMNEMKPRASRTLLLVIMSALAIPVPPAAFALLAIPAAAKCLFAFFVSKSFVRLSDVGIETRFIVTHVCDWADVVEWTQTGAGGISVRAQSGAVFGLATPWLCEGDRNLIREFLLEQIGNERGFVEFFKTEKV